MPNTPLSFPFVHNTMPLSQTKRSFVEWIRWPYHRLRGWSRIERNDPIVFNFPHGDTVALVEPSNDYYLLLRNYQRAFGEKQGRERLLSQTELVYRPVDKRENYVKRVVGMPGDTIRIVHSEMWINGEPQADIPGKQYNYFVVTNGTPINGETLEDMGIAQSDVHYDAVTKTYSYLPLTAENAARIEGMKNVVEVVRFEARDADPDIFPFDERYPWNVDNFGPLWIPQKGATVDLTPENLPLYRRIIEVYEGNTLEEKDGQIFINGSPANRYHVRHGLRFMMGDNRHNRSTRATGFRARRPYRGQALFRMAVAGQGEKFSG